MSERNDSISGEKASGDKQPADKPLGTRLEPTSAATPPRAFDAKPADAKPADVKPAASPASKAASAPRADARPAAPAAARGGMGIVGVVLVALIVSALVAGALIVFAPRWTALVGLRPSPAAPAADPRVAELAQRVDQLAARPAADPSQADALRGQIAKLQDEMARLAKEQEATADALAQVAGEMDDLKPAETGPGNAAIVERLGKLEQQVGELSAALERLRAMRGELEAMVVELGKLGDRGARAETRLAAVEKEVAERRGIDSKATDAARAAAIVSLGTRLRGAIAQGRDGAADIAALKSLAGQDAELLEPINALTPLAGKPPATFEVLRQRFPAVAREIIAADAGDQAQSWWEKALARLQNLVSVRRTGADVTGDDAEARVARAEAALAAGRLDQAAAVLKPLAGQAAKAAAPWLFDAEAALAAQAAADRIVARGAALLAQTGGATPGTR